jgi:hypothetical protein
MITPKNIKGPGGIGDDDTLVDLDPPVHSTAGTNPGATKSELDPVVARALERFGPMEDLPEEEAGQEPTIPEGLMRWIKRGLRTKPVGVSAHARDSAGADAASYATTAAPVRSVATVDPTEKVVLAPEVRPAGRGDPSRELPTVVGVKVHRRGRAAPMLVAAVLGATFAAGIGVRGWLDAARAPATDASRAAVTPLNDGASLRAPMLSPAPPKAAALEMDDVQAAATPATRPEVVAGPIASSTPMEDASAKAHQARSHHASVPAARPAAPGTATERSTDDGSLWKF